MPPLITQKGSSSIIERDGHRASKERSAEPHCCLMLESCLHFGKDFDSFCLHAYTQSVEFYSPWSDGGLAGAPCVMGLEVKWNKRRTFILPNPRTTSVTRCTIYLITGFKKSKGNEHSPTQCPLPISETLKCRTGRYMWKLRKCGICFASTKGTGKLEGMEAQRLGPNQAPTLPASLS